MQYLTKSFNSKVNTDEGIKQTNSGIKDCIKKLNKWLAKPNQQDVKVDDFNFTIEWSTDLVHYRTKLVIIYHHQ